MTDETNDKSKNRFKVVEQAEPNVDEVVEDVRSEELKADEDPSIQQLQFFRNLKLYINKMIGSQWLLLYRREEDGTPIYVPNEHLSIEDQVFLSELAKNIAFNMISMQGQDDY